MILPEKDINICNIVGAHSGRPGLCNLYWLPPPFCRHWGGSSDYALTYEGAGLYPIKFPIDRQVYSTDHRPTFMF